MEEAITINRISSQRQDEGYSLPQQAKLNREAIERDGRKLVKEFNIIESAKASDKRDDFYETVDYLKKHPSTKFVYIEKADRLTRNLKDTVLAYELVNNCDITFVFTRDNFSLNKSSNSHAKFQFDIKAILAKNYVDNLSDEVKKGQRGMLEEGKWPGGASPTGYKKINKLLIPNEPTASFITTAFELYASGSHSLQSLRLVLFKDGFQTILGRPLNKSLIFQILTNPIYYGMMRWNKQLYEGKHHALIDKQLFDRVQEMLKRTRNGEAIPIYTKHALAYKGLMRCGECGYQITGEVKIKKNKGNGKEHRWVYYHCTHFKPCSQTGMIKEENIDEQITELLSTISLGVNTTEWIKNKLKESHQEEIEFRNKSYESLGVRLKKATKRLDDVYDDKLDGVIDESTYHRKRTEYLLEKADLENRIKEHSIADEKYVDFGCLILDVANRASEIYQVRNSEEKKYLCNLVFSNLSLMDKKLKFSFNGIFQSLLNYQNSGDWLRDLDSNQDK